MLRGEGAAPVKVPQGCLTAGVVQLLVLVLLGVVHGGLAAGVVELIVLVLLLGGGAALQGRVELLLLPVSENEGHEGGHAGAKRVT